MSTRALMMIVTRDNISGFDYDSPQNIWKRLRSESKGIVLFRQFDGDPKTVKRDLDKGLALALKILLSNAAINEGTVSSCLISATMKVMPVQATWCPLQEGEIDRIIPVFHYLLILDHANQTWDLYWWKLEEEDFGQDLREYQEDPRAMNYPDLMDKDFYDVLEEFIYTKLA
jgi:hypothetical protein